MLNCLFLILLAAVAGVVPAAGAALVPAHPAGVAVPSVEASAPAAARPVALQRRSPTTVLHPVLPLPLQGIRAGAGAAAGPGLPLQRVSTKLFLCVCKKLDELPATLPHRLWHMLNCATLV